MAKVALTAEEARRFIVVWGFPPHPIVVVGIELECEATLIEAPAATVHAAELIATSRVACRASLLECGPCAGFERGQASGSLKIANYGAGGTTAC